MKTNHLICKVVLIGILLAFILYPLMGADLKSTGFERNTLNPTGSIAHPGAPVTPAEATGLTKDNGFVYWIKDVSGNFANPIIVNPMVNVDDIYNYYMNNNESGKFAGIRFYPVSQNNNMFLLMCLAEGPEGDITKIAEKGYLLLEKGLYLEPGSIALPTNVLSAAEARVYHEAYMKNVLLYKNKQTPEPAPYDSIRTSRFYPWEDIMRLMNQNLPSGADRKKYYFQIDVGYVTNENAVILATRPRVKSTVPQNQGFTVLIHIKDQNGNSLLDPFARYDTQEPNNYLGRYLEVGHPCPPLCGELN